MIDKLRKWLIIKLGGYTSNGIDQWMEEKLRQQLSKEKPKTIDIYEDFTGTYQVKIKFIK